MSRESARTNLNILVKGDSSAAIALRVWLDNKGFKITDDKPYYIIELIEKEVPHVVVDSIDSELERNLINQMYLNGVPSFLIDREGGNQSDRSITVTYPTERQIPVAKGIYQGLRMTIGKDEIQHKKVEEKPKVDLSKLTWKHYLLLLLTLLGIILASTVSAGDMLENKLMFQPIGSSTFPVIRVLSVNGSVIVNVGDSTNNAIRVNCVLGCGAGGGGGTSSVFGDPFPTDGTAIGFLDPSGNMNGANIYDMNTGLGSEYVLGVNLRSGTGSGSFEIGTVGDPLRIDPTGFTVQPVDIVSTISIPVTGTFFQATQPISAAALPLPAGASTLAEQQTQTTALQIIDDWDESDRAKVNPIVGQAGVQGASGTVSANTQRVVLATDVALPTGANTIGSIASITTSVTPGTGASNLGKAEDAGHISADVGVFIQGVRTDPTTTAYTSANTEYSPIGVDHVGAHFVGAHPARFSCFVPLTTTATTQCQAAPAAGLRNYVTSVVCSNGAATVQGVDVVFGTGANCATGTTALTHKFQMGTNQLTTSPFIVSVNFGNNPLVPTAATAICVRPTAATAFGCTLTGLIGP